MEKAVIGSSVEHSLKTVALERPRTSAKLTQPELVSARG